MRPFTHYLDLASPRLGGRVLAASDEFFAPKENLLEPGPPVFIADKFTDRGKWMDGWETRRRSPGDRDWVIIRLGAPGRIHGVVVDTTHFKGNNPEACRLEGCYSDQPPGPDTEWVPVLETTPLKPDRVHELPVDGGHGFTHVRLSIYPDGGVARFRVHGEPVTRLPADTPINLAAAERGARVLEASDSFFASRHNLILPGESRGMADGWETRRRSPGECDWVIVRLAAPGLVERVVVDTSHFKGNAPESVALDALGSGQAPEPDSSDWQPLVERRKVQPHHRHELHELALDSEDPAQYVRLRIFPDGGVARLRVYGHVTSDVCHRRGLDWLNALPGDAAHRELLSCCGAEAWAGQMTAARPFDDLESLQQAAADVWKKLDERDRLQAFAAHPRIGERSARRFSAQEQSGTRTATAEQRAELLALNQQYEDRHGFVFLICATGKTAEEMLEALRKRLANDRKSEIAQAAEEQRKITELRLEKVLTS